MIFLKTEDEIELLRASNLLVGKTLAEIAKVIKPGVTTKELDRVAEEFIRDNGAVPTFKGFPNQYGDPFPASICTSVNEQVVHGIPSDNVVLKEGDVVSVDCGTYMNGFCGDSAYTFCVGEVDEEVRKLLKVTKEALYIGIQNAVQGKRLGDIGYAIQQHCESNSYGVVEQFFLAQRQQVFAGRIDVADAAVAADGQRSGFQQFQAGKGGIGHGERALCGSVATSGKPPVSARRLAISEPAQNGARCSRNGSLAILGA
jgi:hypothetical protein